jgi:hypothetical protein
MGARLYGWLARVVADRKLGVLTRADCQQKAVCPAPDLSKEFRHAQAPDFSRECRHAQEPTCQNIRRSAAGTANACDICECCSRFCPGNDDHNVGLSRGPRRNARNTHAVRIDFGAVESRSRVFDWTEACGYQDAAALTASDPTRPAFLATRPSAVAVFDLEHVPVMLNHFPESWPGLSHPRVACAPSLPSPARGGG